jgi:4-amino-4-deoxy-L-arabinose transferase-like glycosyltransferase
MRHERTPANEAVVAGRHTATATAPIQSGSTASVPLTAYRRYSVSRSTTGRPGNLAASVVKAALLALILIGATVLRLWHLGAQSLWLDEAHAIQIARLPWPDVALYANPLDTNPPGYHVLLHFWMSLFGDSESAVRALSVVCAVASIAVTYVIAKRLVNPVIGLVSALLLAVAPADIAWSQQARPYTFLTLLAGVQVLILFGALARSHQWWRWIAWALAASVAIYTHYTALALLASLTLAGCIVLRDDRRGLVSLLLSSFAALASFAPWLRALMAQLATTGSANQYLSLPTLSTLAETLGDFAAWGGTPAIRVAVTVPAALLAILGAATLARMQRPRSAGILLFWLIGVPLCLALASYFASVYALKFVLVSLPAFLILIAAGAGAMSHYVRKRLQFMLQWSFSSRRLRQTARFAAGLALALVIGSVLALNLNLDGHYFSAYHNEPWRALAAQLTSQQLPGDVILLANPFGYTEPAFDYYYLRNSTPSELTLERHSMPEDWTLATNGETPYTTQDVVTRLTAMLHGHARLWVVVRLDTNAAWAASLIALLPPQYTPTTHAQFHSDQSDLLLSLWVASSDR